MKSIRYYADDSFSIRKLKGVAADLTVRVESCV